MTAKEVADELMKTPKAEVLLRVGNDWCETASVQATGEHRNAVTLTAYNPALPGVIVVEPDGDK